jgi:hypothetical protein
VDIKSQQIEQLVDEVEIQRELFAQKERELGEAKIELTTQDDALDITVETLRINQERLEQSMTEAEQLWDFLQNLPEDLDHTGAHPDAVNLTQGKQAQDRVMVAETLCDTIQRRIQQSKRLTIHLQQAAKEVRDALGLLASGTSKLNSSRHPTKRKRVKEEQAESGDERFPGNGQKLRISSFS